MNFDYQQTQADVTYQLNGVEDWAFKKIPTLDVVDIDAGPENQYFATHTCSMGDAGWALVAMTSIPGTQRHSAPFSAKKSKTASYQLFWKRLKVPEGPTIACLTAAKTKLPGKE